MPTIQSEWFLRCQVGRGMFDSERTVTFTAGSTTYEAIVAVDDVEAEREPMGDEAAEGRVRVAVIERSGDQALIDLPRETFNGGCRVIVPMSLLVRSAERNHRNG